MQRPCYPPRQYTQNDRKNAALEDSPTIGRARQISDRALQKCPRMFHDSPYKALKDMHG